MERCVRVKGRYEVPNVRGRTSGTRQRRELVFLALGAHGTLEFTVRIAFALGVTLVVFLLAFTQRNFALDRCSFQ